MEIFVRLFEKGREEDLAHDGCDAGHETQAENEDQRDFRADVDVEFPDDGNGEKSEGDVCGDVDS